MQEMTKDHYIIAQMSIITGLIEHTKDNIEDTIFEDEKEFNTLLETLRQGCIIAVLRMKNILRDYVEEEEDDYDCF